MTTQKIFAVLLTAAVSIIIAGAAACTAPEPLPTFTPNPTLSPRPTHTPHPTHTPLPTQTPAATATPEPTATEIPTGTPPPPDNTPTTALTATPMRPAATPAPEPTATHDPTFAPRPTNTPEPTNTPKPPNPIAGLQNEEWLNRNAGTMASEIGKLPWAADVVTDVQRQALQELLWLAWVDLDVAWALLRVPWFVDGPESHEVDGIQAARWTTTTSSELGKQLVQKSWFRDGITADEVKVMRNINWAARPEDDNFADQAIDAARQLLDMPFLETVESRDLLAVLSLQRLERDNTEYYLKIMSHPRIADGITHEETKIVALLAGTYSKRPESVDFLLRGVGVFIEERTIQLPHTGETLLAIVRIRNQTTPAMDHLENSVRAIEAVMGAPFHTNYIALYFDDTTTYTIGGTYFGTHMAMSLLYDVEYGRLWDRTPFVIAHEVAHYFWHSGNAEYAWLSEGYAEILASIAENARKGASIGVTNNPCASAKTISELEVLEAEVKTNEFRCNYSLGEQLVLGLYHALGEDYFREGTRTLYQMTLTEDTPSGCEGAKLTICHLETAFVSTVPVEDASKVGDVIDRWYGSPP